MHLIYTHKYISAHDMHFRIMLSMSYLMSYVHMYAHPRQLLDLSITLVLSGILTLVAVQSMTSRN